MNERETRGDVGTPTEYITTRELCKRLSISRSTVYRRDLHNFGVRIGVAWRFNWQAILRHLRMHGSLGVDEE